MRKYTALLLLLFPLFLLAQGNDKDKKRGASKSGIGLKAGLNFANVTGTSSINSSSKTGFNAGIFRSMASQSIFGFRMELVFSRQGYNFKTNTNTGTVDLDYILFANFTAINIGRFAQLYAGANMAYLLNAKADSSSTQGAGAYGSIMSYYNRFDYGLAGGVEVYPYKGILLGARYNVSLANSFNYSDTSPDQQPSFIPKINGRNNVVQIYLGYKF